VSAIDITVPHGAYAITAIATDGNKILTGVTVNRKANHSIQATAGSGDITINGR
jgi:hypothetical protein